MEKALLTVEHLYKSYGGHTVLDDLSFTVRKGEVIVVIGPSGCGKSTLLRCINALEDIQGGQILLNGESVRKDAGNIPQMRQKIGMVFQSYDLFPHMKVMDNLLLGPVRALGRPREEAEKEALEMLARVGLREKADVYPRTLSGGQKQRVALVRAMMMHPEILLLDEITAALDPEMVSEVLNVVIDLARGGMTMAIVTHEMRFAEAVADEVLFLEDGVVVEQGPPEKFFHAPETERAQQFLKSFTYAFKKSEVQPKNNPED